MNTLFLVVLGALLAAVFSWAFRALPAARYQVMAAVPVKAQGKNRYRAANLTWYGLFSAAGAVVGAALLVVLLASVGVDLPAVAVLAAGTLAVGLPASRLLARAIEGKRHTASVAAAYAVGLAFLPVLIAGVNASRLPGAPLAITVVFAAFAISYVLGEAIGRLACISFGCCYGRPVAELPHSLARAFERFSFRFEGETKKIAYASGLAGVRVVPVQALSAIALSLVALGALALFLAGLFGAALVVAVTLSQLWRFVSELLRSDFRGAQRISAYQWMALLSIPFTWGIALFLPAPRLEVDLARGLAALWRTEVVLGLELVAITIFLLTGWSKVTGSLVSLRLYRSRI